MWMWTPAPPWRSRPDHWPARQRSCPARRLAMRQGEAHRCPPCMQTALAVAHRACLLACIDHSLPFLLPRFLALPGCLL